MSDRALRDELERLQVEVKGLEAELAADHGPRFLEQREALRAAVAQAREVLLTVERSSALVDARSAELHQRVESLRARLRALEQRRLGAPPVLVLVPLAFLGLLFTPSGLSYQVVGAVSALLFGVLFGPRLGAWALGHREELPKEVAPPRAPPSKAPVSKVFSRVFAVFALLGSLSHLGPLWRAITTRRVDVYEFLDVGRFGRTMPAQFAALAAFLLALRVRRLNRDVNEAAARSALILEGVVASVLLVIAASWVPAVEEFFRLGPAYGAYPFRSDTLLISAFVPVVPVALLLWTSWRPEALRRTTLAASLACAAGGVAVTLISVEAQRYMLTDYDFGAGWAAIQLAVLGLALAQRRWLAIAACLAPLGVSGLHFFGVF